MAVMGGPSQVRLQRPLDGFFQDGISALGDESRAFSMSFPHNFLTSLRLFFLYPGHPPLDLVDDRLTNGQVLPSKAFLPSAFVFLLDPLGVNQNNP